MRPLNKSRLLVACFLCSVSVASAQQSQSANAITVVPRLVHFAGSFHPPANQPAGPVGGTFAIYSEQEGGTPLWTEDQNVELDANGSYTVMLGATKNAGVPSELFAAGEARWLQVKFYAPGEVDLPRVLLVSVPYALKAADADTLGGRPASAYVLAGSSTSMQPASQSGVAQAAQPEAVVSARTAGDVKSAVTSTGTTNYISKFTDTSGDTGNSVMYQNGSNIGVGTTAAAISMDVRPTATSPYAQLGVAQTVDYMTLFASDTFGPAFYWDAAKALRFGKGGTGLYNANGFVEYMRIQPSGYVGIGTQTPAALLEVKGNAQVDGNLTITGNIIGSGAAGPIILVPNNGTNNVSAGLFALPPTTTGTQNTAVGDYALHSNTSGYYNTATGYEALFFNSGSYNTASGDGALYSNTLGDSDTAMGANALGSNTTGSSNTSTGAFALETNTTGSFNIADGYQALVANTTGSYNTASGANALYHNNGDSNTAAGYEAMIGNLTGSDNTASGYQAMYYNSAGNNNVAIGYQAGYNVTTASNNIHIGHQGLATDSGAIRIGTAGTQTTAFIAGIEGVTTGNNNAVPVLVDSNGQLGTISSSRRYKEDIKDMGETSSGLMHLRPVTFRYKKPFNDGSQPIQYGLIAEEVAEVYPDLVARSTDGQVETVKYQVLDSMLLNELQKQNATIAAQKERIGAQEQQIQAQEQQIRAQEQQVRSLAERLARLEGTLEGNTMTASSR
jgi:hypothetical protein